MSNKSFEIVRGIDINRLLTLNNPHKSKLVACFNNEHKGKIGQLNEDGNIFGEQLEKYWRSTNSDFGYSGKVKRIRSFTIKTSGACKVTFESENMIKEISVKGKEGVQRINTNIIGKEFIVTIESLGDAFISNFVLNVGVC